MNIKLLLIAVAPLALLTACGEPPAKDPGPLAPPMERVPQPTTYPTTPIKLPKPRELGPESPAIVVVPETMNEPNIRIKIGEESDSPRSWPTRGMKGRVENVRLANGKYIGVVTMPLEDYLPGVLPHEILGSFQPATFRAQAIASRTYALFQMLTDGKSRPYDVTTGVDSQRWEAKTIPIAREAVEATRGQVLMTSYNNQRGVFCAFFSACSGGATQDPGEAWGDPSIAPLSARKVGMFEDISSMAHFTWPTMVVSKSDISRCIRAWGERNKLPYLLALGPIKSVVISKRNTQTGRPAEFTLTATNKATAPIRAEEFRLALLHDPAGVAPKPYSSFFDIQDGGTSIYLVNGRGHGHGVGMSQWGAEALARKGRTYTQILAFYYPGASLHQLW